jgi:hypothetical protein
MIILIYRVLVVSLSVKVLLSLKMKIRRSCKEHVQKSRKKFGIRLLVEVLNKVDALFFYERQDPNTSQHA